MSDFNTISQSLKNMESQGKIIVRTTPGEFFDSVMKIEATKEEYNHIVWDLQNMIYRCLNWEGRHEFIRDGKTLNSKAIKEYMFHNYCDFEKAFKNSIKEGQVLLTHVNSDITRLWKIQYK